jgi:Zn-dependent peptidase ImmA (M78 family)
MRAKEFTNTSESKERFIKMFSEFLPIAMHYLKLSDLPKIVFQKRVKSTGQPTFGMYVNEQKTLYVALVNRHPNDILRTIAHELCHYKQDTEHELHDESGTTGSPEENEANAMAGIVMRHFNKRHPEYLGDRPVIAESKHK